MGEMIITLEGSLVEVIVTWEVSLEDVIFTLESSAALSRGDIYVGNIHRLWDP